MFLSQPPVTKVTLEIYGRREFMPWEDRRGLPKWFDGCVCTLAVEEESGVTLGQVIDAVKPKLLGQDRRIANISFQS